MYSSFTRSGPQTKSASVFGASTKSVDLDAELLGLGLVLLDRVDEDAEVVEQRPLRRARIALPQLEPGAADLQPAVVAGREAERLPLDGRGGGVGRDERDVVEVELGVGLGLDQHELEPLAQVDDRLAAVERGDAQADPLEGAALARAFGVEQRQLPAPRVGAEQREPLRLLDHAEPDPAGGLGHPRAVGDPERDVIERPGLHLSRIAVGPTASSRLPRAGAAPSSSSSDP